MIFQSILQKDLLDKLWDGENSLEVFTLLKELMKEQITTGVLREKFLLHFIPEILALNPLMISIKKVLKTGYLHHIERLMVLGNFMMSV